MVARGRTTKPARGRTPRTTTRGGVSRGSGVHPAADVDGAVETQYGPALTIRQAAARAGKHFNTLRKAQDEGRLPKRDLWDDRGRRLIPVGDLEGAGYRLAGGAEAAASRERTDVDRLARELSETREQLARASALAGEREARISDLQEALRVERQALLMLGPGPSGEPRRRWWRRSSSPAP